MKQGSIARALLLGSALAVAAGSGRAQSAGHWMVKGGFNGIEPQVTSGELSAPSLPGSKVDVKKATSLIATATYMLTDQVSVEAYLGLPYKHDIVGDGSLTGVGKIGSVKQVSPTVFAQYRFRAPDAGFRPYVGIGLTYAYFYGAEGSGALTALTNPGGPPTRVSSKSAFGVSPQAGVTIRLHGPWYLDASLVKTFLKNSSSLSTGQTVNTKLDPVSSNLSIGYQF
jgi:outer membrane protein